MNTDDENINENTDNDGADESTGTPTDRRPLGYWLRTVDGFITREFAAAFESEGVTRRDWMLLNLLSGDVDAPGFAERVARKGKRLRRLEDLGWAEEQGDGTWTLTDAGREAEERLGDVVSGIRSRVAGAVSAEDYATTMASLEAIARELGWDETTAFPRGRGFGRGWGRRFGGPRPFGGDIRFGFGPNLHHGFEHGRPGHAPHHGMSHDSAWGGHGYEDEGCHGHGPRGHHGHRGHSHRSYGGSGHRGHGHGGHWDHGHDRGHGAHDRGHEAETAYERGFTAGFGAAQVRDDAPGRATAV